MQAAKKNVKSENQAELAPESSTDSEYTTSDEESTAFVNNTELKAFYKVNGMPVETVYAVRDFKVETDDEKDVYVYREEMLKLVSINGSKAKVLAPVRECVKNRELFYINVDVNDITPDYLEKDLHLLQEKMTSQIIWTDFSGKDFFRLQDFIMTEMKLKE